MRKLVLLLLVIIGTNLNSQSDSNPPVLIRVLTFNILHGATTKGDFDLDKIAQVINNTNPDLVALQEVDLKTNRAHGYDLVTELGIRTNMSPLFGKAMNYDGGEYGEGILYKKSYVNTKNNPLPHSPGNEPRTALEATVVINTDTIKFIGTHLEHSEHQTDRIAQAKELVSLYRNCKYPTILAGDLNAIPGSTPINILETHWTSTYNRSKPLYTYPSPYPDKKIDYIMYSPQERWKVINRQVIQDSIASDHCAYLVVFELLGN